MTTLKNKEGGHSRARRLALGKPHIMWCRNLRVWVLAAYSWNPANLDERMIEPALDYLERLNTRRQAEEDT